MPLRLGGISILRGGIPIEIKIPKEISDYGLSLRHFVCSLLAVGAAPFALCGFVRYHGMSAEQLLTAILRSEVFTPHKLVFKSDNLLEVRVKVKGFYI